MDELVLAVATDEAGLGRLDGVASGPSCSCGTGRSDLVDQDLGRPPDPRPVALVADAFLELEQRVEPAPLLRRGDVVGEPRGGRARPRREGGREDLVEADLAQQVERRLELGLGLAAEPDDDVGREADARDRPRAAAPRARR